MNLKRMIVPTILSSIGLTACGKKSSDSADTGTSLTTRNPGTSKVQATNVSELGLTGALQIELPAAVASKKTSLKLVESKSIEACMMRESAKQLVTQIAEQTSFLCHIEAEGKNIPWNTPALLDFSEMALRKAALEGTEVADADYAIGVYAKETTDGGVEVFLCQGQSASTLSLAQAFKITGSKTLTVDGKTVHASQGNVAIDMDMSMPGMSNSFKGAIAFDGNYTDKDISKLSMDIKFSMEMDPSAFPSGPMLKLTSSKITNSFAQKFNIISKEGGKTKLSISERGTFDDGTNSFDFKKTSVGLFDAVQGNVYYAYDDGSGGFDFSSQACVDADSNLLSDGCDGSKFQSGGDLYLAKTDLPDILPVSYSPDAPTGFDCKTATWTKVTITNENDAAHAKCDGLTEAEDASEGGSDPYSTCFAEGAVVSDDVIEGGVVFEEDTNTDDFEADPGIGDGSDL